MKIHKNFPLSEIVYYRIGGKAKLLLEIQNSNDLLEALDFIQKNNIKNILCIGLGSNLLISDTYFDGVVLWFSKGDRSLITQRSDGLVEAFASVVLDDLIQFTFSNNFIGLEWAGGLPSTIGAAIRGNVGAFGGEIKDSVQTVEFYEWNEHGFSRRKQTGSKCGFSYRNSIFKNNKNVIITNVMFKLSSGNNQELEKAREVYQSHIEYRNTHHPMKYPSCGSVFKNITKKDEVHIILSKWPDIKDLVEQKWHGKVSMGYVIKKLGFSGFQIGGAQVSETHANYIVNKQNAKFNDVVSIIEKIKERFFQEFGFYPEVEVEIV